MLTDTTCQANANAQMNMSQQSGDWIIPTILIRLNSIKRPKPCSDWTDETVRSQPGFVSSQLSSDWYPCDHLWRQIVVQYSGHILSSREQSLRMKRFRTHTQGDTVSLRNQQITRYARISISIPIHCTKSITRRWISSAHSLELP